MWADTKKWVDEVRKRLSFNLEQVPPPPHTHFINARSPGTFGPGATAGLGLGGAGGVPGKDWLEAPPSKNWLALR